MICKVKLLLEIQATIFLSKGLLREMSVCDGKQLFWVRHLLISKT